MNITYQLPMQRCAMHMAATVTARNGLDFNSIKKSNDTDNNIQPDETSIKWRTNWRSDKSSMQRKSSNRGGVDVNVSINDIGLWTHWRIKRIITWNTTHDTFDSQLALYLEWLFKYMVKRHQMAVLLRKKTTKLIKFCKSRKLRLA